MWTRSETAEKRLPSGGEKVRSRWHLCGRATKRHVPRAYRCHFHDTIKTVTWPLITRYDSMSSWSNAFSGAAISLFLRVLRPLRARCNVIPRRCSYRKVLSRGIISKVQSIRLCFLRNFFLFFCTLIVTFSTLRQGLKTLITSRIDCLNRLL